VFDRVLDRMRRLVRFGEYVVTAHALDAMEDDALTVFDLERCVLTGAIVERQRDRARREWKYLVAGYAIDDSPTMVIGKIGRTGRLVIVTVYLGQRGG
jgi:hypothetical protein